MQEKEPSQIEIMVLYWNAILCNSESILNVVKVTSEYANILCIQVDRLKTKIWIRL
jgi:hypothetical protein